MRPASSVSAHVQHRKSHNRPENFGNLLGTIQKKAFLLTKNIEEFSGKKFRKIWPSRQKKDKTERVTGLGRRTREEIAKWNQMKALRFDTGG